MLGNVLDTPLPVVHVSFSGQVPTLVRLREGEHVQNGDLLLPIVDKAEDIGLCRVVRKADATFEEYKLAIGSALNSYLPAQGFITEEEAEEGLGILIPINTAIGHK